MIMYRPFIMLMSVASSVGNYDGTCPTPLFLSVTSGVVNILNCVALPFYLSTCSDVLLNWV